MNWLLGGALLIMALWCGVLLAFARSLRARWREPVFRHPILVFESDDWGAGPLAQTEALRRIAGVLQAFRDSTGRHPVMTLGMVFEVPDTERMAHEGLEIYHARSLEEDCFSELRRVIQTGMASGVFAPQLHGQCHYWPQALLSAAKDDARVRAWLTGPGLPQTESLPSPLQSRWVDASHLPSRPLDAVQIEAAVKEEALNYHKLFGRPPQVAVATTFVWNDAVERAWKNAGVEAVIAPGRRATCRDVAGLPACVDRAMLTGDHSHAGQCYLVRDVYFEPALGHAPRRLADGLRQRTRQGRACLVETHRFNFLQAADASLATLQAGIAMCLAERPDLRFVTPLELAQAIRSGDAAVLETRFAVRLRAWLARLTEIPRFRRVARLTGLALPLSLLERAMSPRSSVTRSYAQQGDSAQ